MLTGGASQLSGVRELAALVLDKQVRMGRPIRVHGLADATGGPAFATGAGLLTFALEGEIPAAKVGARQGSSWIGLPRARIGSWLKENF